MNKINMFVLSDLITGWEIYYNKSEDGFFTNYSWYHILWLGILIISCYLLIHFLARKHNKKIDDYVIFGFGILLIVIEIYKQVFFTIDNNRHYPWYIFPYQFCSVPMYVATIAPFIKKTIIKNMLYKFLAFFATLAGLAVMLYPSSCFSTHYLTILLHTMIWHASLVCMGLYLLVSKNYCRKIKDFFKEIVPGYLVLVVLVIIAVSLNLIAYKSYFGTPKNVNDDVFFLMYLSPYYDCPFPILSNIKSNQPYIVFLLSYLLAFGLGVSLIWFIYYGIHSLKEKFKSLLNKKEYSK